LGRGALGLLGLAVVEIISLAGVFADPVLMVQTDIEPDWAVESTMLVETEPGQFVVENLRRLFIREVTVRQTTIGDCARDAMNQLLNRGFPSASIRIGAVRDIPVKVL